MVRTLSSCNDVWGKTTGVALSKHTNDCKKVLGYIIENQKEVIHNWCVRNDADYETFIKDLEFTLHYHDFGKSTSKWQKNARLIFQGKNVDLPVHAIYSGYLMANDERTKKSSTMDYLPLLVCNSHHSLMTNYSWEKVPLLNTDDINLEYLQDYNKKSGYGEIKLTISWQEYLENLRNFRKNSHRDKFRGKDKSKEINSCFKAHYCFMLSLITAADGIASSLEARNVDEGLFKEEVDKLFPDPKRLSEKISLTININDLTEIQKMVVAKSYSSIDGYKPLIIEAPCGEGKTLASLLWAKKLFETGKINRVIFTLPTQITSNNMYQEFSTDYGIPKKWVGLYHSELMSFLIDEKEDDLEGIKYKNSIYSKPFTISTIDHLLLSLVNGYKFAPRAFGNLQSSLIVIDELHYYDAHTVGMIKCLCTILRDLKIPHIIMSATIPNILKREFSSYAEIQSNGKDNKGAIKSPYNFVFHKKPLLSDDHQEKVATISEEFIELIHKSNEKNIGVIVNTVPKSKCLFKTLRDEFPKMQILLYNSEFMRKDRVIKEKLVKILGKRIDKKLTDKEIRLCEEHGFDPKKPIIFIGTQVAEISLNISFDIILSDLAPLDALFQRGGRLHRKRTYPNSEQCNCKQCKRFEGRHNYELHVFETGEFCYPYYNEVEDLDMKDVIETTRKIVKENPIFKFRESLDWISEVYSNKEMFEKFNPDISFWNVYKEDLIFGGKPSKDEDGNLRIITREIDVMPFDVLPQSFNYNKELVNPQGFINKIFSNKGFITKNKKLNKKGINEITRHMLKVSNKRYYPVKGKPIYMGDKWLVKTVELDYNFENGLYKNTTII